MDDEVLKLGLSESKATSLLAQFQRAGTSELVGALFQKFVRAQRLIENKHRVDRMILLRREKDQLERMYETGQDMYMDTLR